MSEIYRCPKCDATAIETMWDETTINFLRERFAEFHFTAIKDASRLPEVGHQYKYKCPYCSEHIALGKMTPTSKIKIQRTGHLDDDLFTV